MSDTPLTPIEIILRHEARKRSTPRPADPEAAPVAPRPADPEPAPVAPRAAAVTPKAGQRAKADGETTT